MIFFRTSTPYDLSLYQVGYEKCSENHFFGPVIRDFYVLHFVVSGKGTYRVREKNIPLQKGDCFLVIPNEPTYYEADHSDPYEYYWIGFHGTNSKKLMISLGFYTDDNFIFHCDGSVYEDMLSYMQELKSLYEPDEKTYLFCLGRLYEVLSLMKKKHADGYGAARRRKPLEADMRICCHQLRAYALRRASVRKIQPAQERIVQTV